MKRIFYKTNSAFRSDVTNNRTIGNEVDLCDVICPHGDVQGAHVYNNKHEPIETLVLCEKCYETNNKRGE